MSDEHLFDSSFLFRLSDEDSLMQVLIKMPEASRYLNGSHKIVAAKLEFIFQVCRVLDFLWCSSRKTRNNIK